MASDPTCPAAVYLGRGLPGEGMMRTVGALLACIFLLVACDSDRGAPDTADRLVASRGAPSVFSVECLRHAWDADAEAWVPQAGYVRVGTWVYAADADGEESQVLALLNGEVIAERLATDSLGEYPRGAFDPRTFGCGESRLTVESVLGDAPVLTTEGTSFQAALDLDGVRLVAAYYRLGEGPAGLVVLYANDRLIGMMSS